MDNTNIANSHPILNCLVLSMYTIYNTCQGFPNHDILNATKHMTSCDMYGDLLSSLALCE